MHGQQVCGTHGGRAPQNVAAGRRRQQEERARRAVETYGLPVDVDPHEALLDEVRRTAGHVEWLEALIHDLPHDLDGDGTSGLKQYETSTLKGEVMLWERPSVWVELYQRERTHLVKACKDAIGAGVEERRVKIAEQDGRRFASAYVQALEDPEWGLSEEQQAAGRKVMARLLRELTEGDAA